jgi:light-regulated signal transduction histidine kinase (bacteriophytochrome)
MAQGNLTARVPAEGHDEVGQLARDFNTMADQLARTYEELEERVRERTAQLERSNADLAMFASVASHDLREPLRIVTMSVQQLARRYGDEMDDTAKKWMQRAVNAAGRMATLIADTLAFARVGSADEAFSPTDCDAVLDQALANLAPAIGEAEAVITRGPLPTVTASPSQIERLLRNLTANAIKFRGDTPPHVHIQAERGEGEWVFSVSDNGMGVAPEHTAEVFTPFHRLHSRDEYPGTGIGLATCKRILERHGGRIWVQSTPGAGSTFYFTIPDGGPNAASREAADDAH